jgi:GNAT superfamily N-acetyltransferase
MPIEISGRAELPFSVMTSASAHSGLSIKRITKIDPKTVEEINSVSDEGKTWDEEEGLRFLADKDNALFLAYWNNEISGFLTAHRLQRFDERKAEILLYEIGVNEEFRKKGIGKALIEAVKAWGREVQADEVWVLTNRSNQAAMALYKSAGGLEASPDDMMFVFKL